MTKLLVAGYLLGAVLTTFVAGAAVVEADNPNVGLTMVLVAVWPFTVLLVLGMMWWGDNR